MPYANPCSANKTARNWTATNTGQVLVATECVLKAVDAYNLNAAVRYLKFYDKATAATSSDTPVLTIPLKATDRAILNLGDGLVFKNGISIRSVTELADNGTTGATSGETIVNILYN